MERTHVCLLVAERLAIEHGRIPTVEALRREAQVANATASKVRKAIDQQLREQIVEPNHLLRWVRVAEHAQAEVGALTDLLVNEGSGWVWRTVEQERVATPDRARVGKRQTLDMERSREALWNTWRLIYRQGVAASCLDRSRNELPSMWKDAPEQVAWSTWASFHAAAGFVANYGKPQPPPDLLADLLDAIQPMANRRVYDRFGVPVAQQVKSLMSSINNLVFTARRQQRVFRLYSVDEERWIPFRLGVSRYKILDSDDLAAPAESSGWDRIGVQILSLEDAAALAYGVPLREDGSVDQRLRRRSTEALRKRLQRKPAEARRVFRITPKPQGRGVGMYYFTWQFKFLKWLDSDAWRGRRARRSRGKTPSD